MLHHIYEASNNYQGNWKEAVGYAPIIVHWSLDINTSEYYSLTPLSRKESNKKELPGRKILTPDKARSTDIFPILPDDTGAYLFGLWGYQSRQQNKAYMNLLEKAIAATDNPKLKIYHQWLVKFASDTNMQKRFQERVLDSYKKGPQHNTPNNISKDKFIVLVNGERLANIPSVKEYWQKHFVNSHQLTEGSCIITGDSSDKILTGVIPAKIKGVCNTLSSGSSLISFGRTAFTSYGLSESQNTSIDFFAVLKTYSFFNHLLASEENHLKVGDLSVLLWGDELSINNEFWSGDSSLEDYYATKFVNIFKRVQTGNTLKSIEELDELQSETFHMFILKGNSGRVSIQDYQKTTANILLQNITMFVEYQISSLKKYFQPREDTGYTLLNLWQIRRLCFRNPKQEYSANFDKDLLDALLLNKQLPVTFIHKVMSRFFVDIEADYFQMRRVLKAIALYFGLKGLDSTNTCPEHAGLLEILRMYLHLFYRANLRTRPIPLSVIRAFISHDKLMIAHAIHSMFQIYSAEMSKGNVIDFMFAIAPYLPEDKTSFQVFLQRTFNMHKPAIIKEFNDLCIATKHEQLSCKSWMCKIKEMLDAGIISHMQIINLCKTAGLKHWQEITSNISGNRVSNFEQQALNLWYLM